MVLLDLWQILWLLKPHLALYLFSRFRGFLSFRDRLVLAKRPFDGTSQFFSSALEIAKKTRKYLMMMLVLSVSKVKVDPSCLKMFLHFYWRVASLDRFPATTDIAFKSTAYSYNLCVVYVCTRKIYADFVKHIGTH